jgi:Icc-related predicted phosphoesterase
MMPRIRLLCCSDTHGQRPPDLDETGAVAWLHAGDVYEGPASVDGDEAPLPGDPIAEPVRSWLAARRVPVLCVHGNHDVADPYRWFDTADAIDGRVRRLSPGLVVAGIGWHGERYYECPIESDLETVCDSVRRQLLRVTTSSDLVVLLTHYPTRIEGLFPLKPGAMQTAGYDAVTRLVNEVRPSLIVQGHEHFWFGRAGNISFGARDALIVNPGPTGVVVDINVERGVAEVG